MKFPVTLLLVILVGCANQARYIQPDSADSPTIHGKFTRKSAFNWESYSVLSIDGKEVSYGFSMNIPGKIINIRPGERKLIVLARYNLIAFGDGPYEAIIPIGVTASAGKSYSINGEVDGEQFRIWIEDESTNAPITALATANYSTKNSK